jgi:hypothetical protein
METSYGSSAWGAQDVCAATDNLRSADIRTTQRQQRKEPQGANHGRSSCSSAWVRASSQRVVLMP